MNQKKYYKFIDLFAGIGGFHLGMKQAGAKCVFASEWNEFSRKTYKENFYRDSSDLFESNNFVGDITKINPLNIPDFDILCGGFPCQPFSNSGLKKGFDDKRGNLFFNIADIIKIKEPKAFLLENVRGLLSHNSGDTFSTIRKILKDELGYSFEYKILKGSDYGVPQLRPRLYMVGFKDKNIKFKFPDPVKLKTTMSDVFNGKCSRDIGFTLRCGGRGSGINDRRNWDCYEVDGKEIQISPKEGLLMNGFPSDFHFPVSKTQAMKQLGNSVIVPIIKAIGINIIQSLNTKK